MEAERTEVVTITRFEPPRGFTFENGGTLETTVRVTFEPKDCATLFTSRFTARPHGLMKAVFPIFKRVMADFEKANMGFVKAAIENPR
jgi:hypothetical protein